MATVIWANKVNVTSVDSQLTKTGGSDGSDDAGATSQQIITLPSEIEFRVSQTNKTLMVGISNQLDNNTAVANLDFFFWLDGGGTAEARTGSTFLEDFGAYTTSTVFKLRVESDRTVKWYMDGTLKRTSAAGAMPVTPLVMDVTIRGSSAAITSATVTGAVAVGVVVTIDGVEHTNDALLNGLKFSLSLGSEWTANFPVHDVLSTASAYRPALGQTVTIADGGTTLFNGRISKLVDRPILSPHVGTLTEITARAYSGVVDQVIVTETYLAGNTLNAVVNALRVNYLAAYGITLDASMGTGATLEEQMFKEVTMREVLNHLSTITGWLWRITPNNELQMFPAGNKTASYSLTAANRLSVGPVTWDKTREKYVNSVVLRYGTETQVDKTFTATGTGSVASWVLEYEPAVDRDGYIISRGLVTEGGADKTLSAPAGGGDYTWTAATNTLARAAGNLGAAVVITLPYAAQFPQVVTVEDSAGITANGRYGEIFEAPEIFDTDAATELADGILRRYLAEPKWVHLSTRQAFVMPGDQITLTFADRVISGDHIVTEVRGSSFINGTILYELTCLSGAEKQETWTDQLRAAIGFGGARAAGGTISGSVVPNISGRFDGDVMANAGGIVLPRYESVLSQYVNSGGYGPSVMLGRPDRDYTWAMFADSQLGGTPGTIAGLKFHATRMGSSIECAMMLIESPAGAGADWYLVPGAAATLNLGDITNATGLGSPQNTINSIKVADITATQGYLERSRTVKMGDYAAFTPVLKFGGATTGITYSAQVGGITLVGSTAVIEVGLTLTSKGTATGVATITGVPNAQASVAVGSAMDAQGMTGLTGAPTVVISASTFFPLQTSATGRSQLDDTHFTNTSVLRFGFPYRI